MEKEKDYNIEVIRLISFVLVILIHVTNYYCRAYGEVSGGEYIFALILDTFARVSVPCFFMITGALLLGRLEKIQKNWRRIARFLVVLVFWSLVYYVHNRFYMHSKVSLLGILYEPTEPHLWYLYAMIPIYLAVPFFQIMCRGMRGEHIKWFALIGSVVIVIMYGLSFFGAEFYYDMPILGDRVYTYYFVFGYFIYLYKKYIRISKRTLLAVFVGSNVINVALTAAVSYMTGDHYERFLEYECPLVIVSSMSFFLFMLRAGGGNLKIKEKNRQLLDKLCACSFGIYLIHILFLDNYKRKFDAADVSGWIIIPLLTLGILLISFASICLIRKVPGGKRVT